MTEKKKSLIVKGHGLVSEGAPFDEFRRRLGFGTGTYGVGRGLCTCGDFSPVHHSAADRKRWHRQHKEMILKEQLLARDRESFSENPPAPNPAKDLDSLRGRIVELIALVHRHTELESDPVQFRHADTGVWWDVEDVLDSLLGHPNKHSWVERGRYSVCSETGCPQILSRNVLTSARHLT